MTFQLYNETVQTRMKLPAMSQRSSHNRLLTDWQILSQIDEILSKIDNFLNNCSIQVNGVTNQLLFILIKDPSVSQETYQECCLLPKHIVVCCPLSDHTWDNKRQQTAII